MRYILVKTLWLLVKLIPQPLRRRMRESLLLTAWYTAALCKVGLHPSVNAHLAEGRQHTTSELPLDQDYLANISYQDVQISNYLSRLENQTESLLSVLIVCQDDDDEWDALGRSLASLSAQIRLNKVWICVPQHQNIRMLRSIINDVTPEHIGTEVLTCLSHMPLAAREQATFICRAGEELHPHCIATLCAVIAQNGTSDYYTDTDQKVLDNRFAPRFFPDWNPDYQLSWRYVQSSVVLRDLNPLIDFATAHADLSPYSVLAEYLCDRYLQNPNYSIAHVPLVLLHSNFDPLLKQPIDTSELFTVEQQALVSLIIPTYNGLALVRDCIESILQKTKYSNYEILLIDNNSDDPDALAYFAELNEHPAIRVIPYPHAFNYSAINNFAVSHAKGEIIGLVNNDIEVIEPKWLSKMVAHVLRPDIACVGAKLLYSNGLIQHAGVVMGYGGGAGHAHKYFPNDESGYLYRASATQNFSAVTAACLLVSREDFDAVGGLNEQDLTVAFNDVDFCLRLAETGKRNLLCAEALLYHHESVSRGHEDTPEKQRRFRAEVDYLQSTWAKYIEHDPAYNPNLTLKYENFTINTELSI